MGVFVERKKIIDVGQNAKRFSTQMRPAAPTSRPCGRAPRPLIHATVPSRAVAVASARTDAAAAFYEGAWSRPDGGALLAALVADDHVQTDAVWQAGVQTVGRDRLNKGMRHMRRIYPDLAFTVNRVAEADDGAVFCEWSFSGTFEGRRDAGRGVTVFQFDDQDRIAASTVFRTALPAEVDLAERSARGGGAVRQGVLLQRDK